MTKNKKFIFRFKSRFSKSFDFVHKEIHEDGAYLLPLRIFIGIGWIRASIEKLFETAWYDGTALREFLESQIEVGVIQFPIYQNIVETVFIPNVGILTWIIISGQLLTGISILTGTFTNLGLLSGMFMNFNFVLIGRVSPSAFYIIIQFVLFIGNIGSVIGVDTFLNKYISVSFLVAQDDYKRRYLLAEKISFIVLAILGLLFAGYSFLFIEDFSPNSIEDSAMLLFILSQLTSFGFLIAYFRLQPHDVESPEILSPPDLIVNENDVGNYILWKVTDDNPDLYFIMSGGEVIQKGKWLTGEEILFNVDDLPVGNHRIVITVIDWYGNSNTNSVIVTVLDDVKSDETRTMRFLQYFRDILRGQIDNFQHTRNLVKTSKDNLIATIESLNPNTKSMIYERYNKEISTLTERAVYLDSSIDHVMQLLEDLNEEQSKYVVYSEMAIEKNKLVTAITQAPKNKPPDPQKTTDDNQINQDQSQESSE